MFESGILWAENQELLYTYWSLRIMFEIHATFVINPYAV